jgi:hypothetical protein
LRWDDSQRVISNSSTIEDHALGTTGLPAQRQ